MQSYQIFTTIPPLVAWMDFLISPHVTSSMRQDKRVRWTVDGPVVPGSPGRAIRLHPYPPSRRRR